MVEFLSASGMSGPPRYPVAALVQGSDGNLYGTTVNGGAADCSCGTLYQLTLTGTVTQLAVFEDVVNGRWPVAVPLQGADGLLYITTSRGPSLTVHDGGGAVLQINNSLAKPKPTITNFSPSSGSVGQKVTISGTHFIGATSVQFNGTAAAFTLKSTGAVVATVPAGATTGPITITNGGGSATSTSSFTVP